MTALEQLLREAWDAGYQAATNCIHEDLYDIPVEHFFEKYIEQVINSLENPRGEE